jgi:hypothetical protein
LSLKDAAGREHLRVTKPWCVCQGEFCCCCENKFKVNTQEEKEKLMFILLLINL